MKFLIDAQLPPALARAIGDIGHDAVHVADIGLQAATDRAVWQEAASQGRIIITKDEDFVGSRAERLGQPAPAVVWIRLGNVTRRSLLNSFLPLLQQLVELIEAGERVVEIRGP
ncbi:MAG: DUF5615 family PIN-like protein [Actinomycetota bacterium]